MGKFSRAVAGVAVRGSFTLRACAPTGCDRLRAVADHGIMIFAGRPPRAPIPLDRCGPDRGSPRVIAVSTPTRRARP